VAVGVGERFVVEDEGLYEKFIKDIPDGSREV
jgi:hypothetical protein